jgi:hypothetical protein
LIHTLRNRIHKVRQNRPEESLALLRQALEGPAAQAEQALMDFLMGVKLSDKLNGGGKAAEALGLTGSPREAEYTLIARDVAIAASLDAPLCVQHISTAEGVDYVRKARAAHPSIHAEATPHHFSLTEDAILFVQPEPGMEIIVITNGLQTASLESILVNATEVLPLPVVQEVFDMAGTITEIGEGFIMIQSAEGQMIQVNTFEETIFEGKEIAVGDFIHVTYNGMMTFSIPAQISAQKIGCYAHTGVVGEITDGQFALETEMEMILVNATAEQIEGIEAGMTVTVYSNGAMTMSLPAQIGAEFITVTETITD